MVGVRWTSEKAREGFVQDCNACVARVSLSSRSCDPYVLCNLPEFKHFAVFVVNFPLFLPVTLQVYLPERLSDLFLSVSFPVANPSYKFAYICAGEQALTIVWRSVVGRNISSFHFSFGNVSATM